MVERMDKLTENNIGGKAKNVLGCGSGSSIVTEPKCRVNGVAGICISTSKCNGRSISGFCASPKDIQCCI
ncbi:hypothetical protein I4U23_001275 [Adineta vaga]|nr:hypothetical protein I4U23_001275 [Adineta vaga]